ncbi:hypothetical protein MTO96_003861 [Rhipicephalus appendiculatus]
MCPPSEGCREEESPGPDDKDTAALDGAVLLSRSSSASEASVREDRSDARSPCEVAPVAITSPSKDMSEKSSEKVFGELAASQTQASHFKHGG